MNLIKKIILRILGPALPFLIECWSAVISFYLHIKYSFDERDPERDLAQLKYYLIKHCHIVEKGMALPHPREAFGQPKIRGLIARTEAYEQLGGKEVGQIVRDTLRQYRELHRGKENLFEPDLIEKIDVFIDAADAEGKGGLKWLEKKQWNDWSVRKFDEFVSFRHSVRDFDSSPVDVGLLKSAIAAGLKTPSVCNRQGWFVHYYENKVMIKELLSHQNGNAGFTDCIDKLLIVTGNIMAFTRHEQNQLFIDGGLLSMNIMLAIHAAGLGSCPLNTSMPYMNEKKLIKAAGIAESQRLIMMIAVGNLKENFAVAHSEKLGIDNLLISH